MKHYLSTVLALACLVLVISLVVMKRGDNAQHENDVNAIADFSNQLDSAQMQVNIYHGTILILSNSLDEGRSASLTFSNQWRQAESAGVLDAEQITNLNQQLAGVESENQTLDGRVMDLTNQVADLTRQTISVETNLDEANKNYALLEDRLRRDVAARVVVERKFYNLAALQAQIRDLKENPFGEAISAESIYAGLDVEVKSDGTVRVISPN